jgi:hypothetical protein
MFVMQLLYHASSAQSTPSFTLAGAWSPTSLTLVPWGLQSNPKMQIPRQSSNWRRRLKPSSAARLGDGASASRGSAPGKQLRRHRDLDRIDTSFERLRAGCDVWGVGPLGRYR